MQVVSISPVVPVSTSVCKTRSMTRIACMVGVPVANALDLELGFLKKKTICTIPFRLHIKPLQSAGPSGLGRRKRSTWSLYHLISQVDLQKKRMTRPFLD
jgi:hypothetical protein